MTKIEQQPDQENAQTPERILNAPEGEQVEVREYDETGIKEVIGTAAIDIKNAVVRVVANGEGQKPIPHTVDAKKFTSKELDEKMQTRLESIYKTLDPKIGAKIDQELFAKFKEFPDDFVVATRSFLENFDLRIDFDELGIGKVNKKELSPRRTAFIEKLESHVRQVVTNKLGERVPRYINSAKNYKKTGYRNGRGGPVGYNIDISMELNSWVREDSMIFQFETKIKN